jgi:hypothetical protein
LQTSKISQLCFVYAPANFHLPLFLLLLSVLCLPITHTSSLICSHGLCVVPTVMVQLFNVPKIALIEEQHLLEKFILVFKRVLEICLVRYPLKLKSLLHVLNAKLWKTFSSGLMLLAAA